MIDGDELERSYKHHLSDYSEWEQRDHASDWVLVADNLGEALSIDETMLQEDLVTILSNKAGHCKQGTIVSIVRGTKAEDIIEVLMQIPEEERQKVKEVTMDLSSSMRAIIAAVFPNATIVLDCFHVLKRCHDAIEEVRLHLKRDAQVELRRQERAHRETQKRRAQQRKRYRKKHPRKPGVVMRGRPPKRKNERFKAPTYSNGDTKLELLTRSKRALTQSRDKWSDKTKERMRILFDEEPKLKEAYDIVNCLRSIFRSKTLDKESARVKLHDWYDTATRCSLREIKSARDAIKSREDEVLNYFINHSTNAGAESLNSKIKSFRSPYVTGIAELDPHFVADILKTRFKIVHAHSPFATGLAAQRVATIQNIPVVGTFHSKYRDDFSRVVKSKRLLNSIIKNIVSFYERCDEVWVPQESVKEVIREYGFKGNVEVVDNGCDLVSDYPDSYFAESRSKLGLSQDEFVLLFVGQHIWEKNIRFILDGLEKLKDIPFRMFFVGNGYAANEMKHIISEKGLDSKVTMAGNIADREVMKRYYAAADLFLFPSLYDNAPLVVREAAALHTPSVMIEGATASSILTDSKNGFLVGNSVEEFAGRIRKLSSEKELVRNVGIQASQSIVRSWEDVVEEVIDRYNSLIRRRSEIR